MLEDINTAIDVVLISLIVTGLVVFEFLLRDKK